MSNQLCLSLLKNIKPRLTTVENKVAEYILANSDKIPFMTVEQLGKAAGVAPSGVIRLCKSMGYSGFSELKIDIAINSQTAENIILPAVDKDDDISMVFDKVFNSSIKTLKDTLAMIDKKNIEKAVNLLKNANRIEFYGVGTSATIAQDAYYRFMRIGSPAFYATDSHIMRISAANMTKGTVAVGISHCGATTDTIETLMLAKKTGADIIVITSNKDSPICKYADIVLNVYSDESRYPIEAVSARIAHIAVLDALCVALSLADYERTMEHVKSFKNISENLRLK